MAVGVYEISGTIIDLWQGRLAALFLSLLAVLLTVAVANRAGVSVPGVLQQGDEQFDVTPK